MRMLGALALTPAFPRRGMASATAYGPFTGPVGSIMWLPATAGTKIGTPSPGINRARTADFTDEGPFA
jgi:hypothetical protein